MTTTTIPAPTTRPAFTGRNTQSTQAGAGTWPWTIAEIEQELESEREYWYQERAAGVSTEATEATGRRWASALEYAKTHGGYILI